jgi:hypothetical protein
MFRVLRQDGLLKKRGRPFSLKVGLDAPFEYANFWKKYGNLRELEPANYVQLPKKDWARIYVDRLGKVCIKVT